MYLTLPFEHEMDDLAGLAIGPAVVKVSASTRSRHRS